MVGEQDYATPPAMAQDIANRIPGAGFAVIPNARHYSPLEVPEIIARGVSEMCAAAARALA
jgi:3-oxoadipate enol-lactonase